MSEHVLYTGSVMHRRVSPRMHRFRYRAFWLMVELNVPTNNPKKLRLFSINRPNLFSLYDRDHGDGTDTPIRVQIEKLLFRKGVNIAGGRVRLVCMPRMLGFCFNPLSVYFCDFSDGSPAALVYEVHNTFSERHSYVIPVAKHTGRYHLGCRKNFYVSPFLDMDMTYAFSVTGPGERLAIAIRASKDRTAILYANMVGQRRPLNDMELLKQFFLMPAMTLKVYAAIHWEALRLWSKGIRLRPRPKAKPESESAGGISERTT
jgi:uncharacterized protein